MSSSFEGAKATWIICGISWPPVARNEQLPFPPVSNIPNLKLENLTIASSTADDKWFFPSSLHRCSVWWPFQRAELPEKTDPPAVWVSILFSPKRSTFLVGGFFGGPKFQTPGGLLRRSDAHPWWRFWTSGYGWFQRRDKQQKNSL